MTAAHRQAEHYLHGLDGPVVVVPGRVAAWLDRQGLSALRVRARGVDPEVDAVLAALHLASLSWRTSVSAKGATEAAGSCAEVAAELTWVDAAQAADLLGITPHGVRLAIREQRLCGERVRGRWRIAREDLQHYAASRAA